METRKKTPAVLSWSGGKDSALALHQVKKAGEYNVRALFTTFNGTNKRVTMHGIHENLVQKQAESLDIPLVTSYLTDPSDRGYERTVRDQLFTFHEDGIRAMIFGDINLEDLRQYREQLLKGTGITGIFPLWGKNTHSLIREFLELNFKTMICSLDAGKLPKELAGQVISEEILGSFPGEIDPCGENGEFHTFCFDGPVFRYPIPYRVGEILEKSYPAPVRSGDKGEDDPPMKFWFCDLLTAKDRHSKTVD